jgi:hypothetical protein
MSRKECHIGDGDRIRIESPFPWGLVIVVVAALLVVGVIAYIALTALSRNSLQPAAPQPIPISVAPPTATTPVPATPAPAPISVVTFPDSKLEAAIRQAVNKRRGTITAADLASLTVLDAGEKGIADLTGIEYCVNLTGLN